MLVFLYTIRKIYIILFINNVHILDHILEYLTCPKKKRPKKKACISTRHKENLDQKKRRVFLHAFFSVCVDIVIISFSLQR